MHSCSAWLRASRCSSYLPELVCPFTSSIPTPVKYEKKHIWTNHTSWDREHRREFRRLSHQSISWRPSPRHNQNSRSFETQLRSRSHLYCRRWTLLLQWRAIVGQRRLLVNLVLQHQHCRNRQSCDIDQGMVRPRQSEFMLDWLEPWYACLFCWWTVQSYCILPYGC